LPESLEGQYVPSTAPAADDVLDTEAKKVGFVEDKASAYNYYIHAYHRQVYESILWYVGEHYLEFNHQSRRFSLQPTPRYIPRTVTNLIFPKCEVGVQLFLDSFPDAAVKPSTREPADRKAAEVAQYVRKQKWRDDMMDMKMRDAGVWTVVTGNAYALNFLDRANKERVRVPVEEAVEEPVLDEQGRWIPATDPESGEVIMQGDGTPLPLSETKMVQSRDETGEPLYDEKVLADVNTMVITPLEIVPDFGARYPWEMRHYVHFRSFDLDYLKSQFGADATKDLKPESGQPLNTYYQFKLLDLIARSEGSRGFGFSAPLSGADAGDWLFMRNSAILKTYFEIPCDTYPHGRILCVANGKLLLEANYDELYGEKLNLNTYRWSVMPGQLFAFGMVKNLIDPQKRLNGLDTQRALHRKTMGNAAWLVPVGSKFSEGTGTNEPGHVYLWKKNPTGQAPMRLDPKAMPFDLEVERRNLLRDMEEISGIRNVLAGENPPGVTAGVSLDILTEAAGKRFSPMVRENREAFRRMEMGRLSIAQKAPAWGIPRLITVLGEDGEYEARRFKGADFNGDYDVHLEAVNPSLFSTTQKKQDVVQAINLQLIDIVNSPQNRELARKILNVSEFEEPFTPDMRIALYENGLLLAGQQVNRGPRDDDAIHLTIHDKLFKRTDLMSFPKGLLQLWLQHVQEHEQALAAAVEAEEKNQVRLKKMMDDKGGPEKGKPAGAQANAA